MPNTQKSVTPPGQPAALSVSSLLLRLALIGTILLVFLALLAYAGGWLTPGKLTPAGFVNAFEQINGEHLGFRRNHAKGVCVSGYYDSNGEGTSLSSAEVFKGGRLPVIGRFALAGGQPFADDKTDTVRSMALLIRQLNGQEWRMGMNSIPVFPVRTPEAFYEQLFAARPVLATGKPDPARMKAFLAKYPESAKALAAIKGRLISSGFDDSTYNSLDAFLMTNAKGVTVPVRWAMAPVQPFVAKADPASVVADKNVLFTHLIKRLQQQPLQWHLLVSVGQAGDPTNDATVAWPADRQLVDVGTLTLNAVSEEGSGACRDINFDPLVLPTGIAASDDPLLSARSAVYSRSFTRRAGEPKLASAVSVAEPTAKAMKESKP